MGIEQIRMNQTNALPPASQFNWSQMESNPHVSGNAGERRPETRESRCLPLILSRQGLIVLEPNFARTSMPKDRSKLFFSRRSPRPQLY
jgi:hypothetical protein